MLQILQQILYNILPYSFDREDSRVLSPWGQQDIIVKNFRIKLEERNNGREGGGEGKGGQLPLHPPQLGVLKFINLFTFFFQTL